MYMHQVAHRLAFLGRIFVLRVACAWAYFVQYNTLAETSSLASDHVERDHEIRQFRDNFPYFVGEKGTLHDVTGSGSNLDSARNTRSKALGLEDIARRH